MPGQIEFQTKPQIALRMIRWAREQGVPVGVVLTRAGYGADAGLGEGIEELGLPYVAGVLGTVSVWRPSEGPATEVMRRARTSAAVAQAQSGSPAGIGAVTGQGVG